MPPYDKQGLISSLYQEFTQMGVWPRQCVPNIPHPFPTINCKVPTEKEATASFLPSFRIPLASSALVLCLLPGCPLSSKSCQTEDTVSLVSISDFPQDPAAEHCFLHCSVAFRQVTTRPRLQGYFIQLIPAKGQHTGSCLGWERQESDEQLIKKNLRLQYKNYHIVFTQVIHRK